jgi:hypothetical protein
MMKTLILASAAMLTLSFCSAFSATTRTVRQNQQQVVMKAQTNGPQTGSSYTASSNGPANTAAHIGGWEPLPPYSMSGGD